MNCGNYISKNASFIKKYFLIINLIKYNKLYICICVCIYIYIYIYKIIDHNFNNLFNI